MLPQPPRPNPLSMLRSEKPPSPKRDAPPSNPPKLWFWKPLKPPPWKPPKPPPWKPPNPPPWKPPNPPRNAATGSPPATTPAISAALANNAVVMRRRTKCRLVIDVSQRRLLGCGHGVERNLDQCGGRGRCEYRRRNTRCKVPFGKYRDELRLRWSRLVSDHQLARDKLRPGVDPDLPVDVLLDECKRAAALAIHIIR